MKSLSLLALLASASCSVLPRGRPQDVHVVLHAHKESSEASIEIFNKEHSALLLHSCASTLTSGPFKDHHIDFTVDENGAGSLAVGSKQYTIHHDAAKSGGIECDRIVNDVETLISCLVPLPYDIQLATKDNVSVSDCFTQAPAPVVLHHVRRGLLGNLSFPPELSFPPHRNGEGEKPPTRSLSLDRRQGQCWTSSSYSVRVGDGNPHQNPLNIQLSEAMQCGQASCSAGASNAVSFDIGFSASATLFSWLSGGFSVGRSISTGNSYTCTGNPGDYFAIWKSQAQTAYTVQNYESGNCNQDIRAVGDPLIIWSPNNDNRGGFYYCVYGQNYVRSRGDRWLDTTGRAGGP
ncbi:hypothetical protein NQ176_g7141 [Zarea fungicola]|uniref:Uncharacterized protein n=1 Tax=Zarea fungicola TaxID=93591 RepID=A0ACC1N074_9HYPO|nr:hypothetical protein NQ176_g7141 [Lecanicillium fungicola]